MTDRQALTIDLFDGKCNGAWLGEWESTERGYKPKVRKFAYTIAKTQLAPLNRTETLDYEIDRDENVKVVHTDFAYDLVFLIPTEDVPGCSFEDTILGELLEHLGKLKKTNSDRVKELKKEKKRLERQNKKLKEEDEERQKHRSRQTRKEECPDCGKPFSYQKWTANDGECPNCDYDHPKYSDNGGG